jgi:hypothetical protein
VYSLWQMEKQRNSRIPRTIMRRFQTGAGFSGLAALLALLLSAPIFLHAQNGSSSPSRTQSQPAQPAASASPAQAGQPCSPDVAPILKRGKQADLPPCPDAPPAASSPADSSARSEAQRPLNPAQSLIERAREAAFEFSEKLPNFICQEIMSRFAQSGRGDETPLDVVSTEIIYEDGRESYRNVKINDRPTDKGMEEIDGSWSTGEFASTLLALLHPDTDAVFRPAGQANISGQTAQVYDYDVRGERSHWTLTSGSQTITVAYRGSVWVDPQSARVLRIEMQARDLPSDFPTDTVESAVDYSYVYIDGASFLLPVHAESLGCQRGTNQCRHNTIDFRNYHEFKAEIRIPH